MPCIKVLLSLICVLCIHTSSILAQTSDSVFSFTYSADITVTIDRPSKKLTKEPILILYALPNGNTTAQTMGKKMKAGDDWHYNIQHIRAQTQFIRSELNDQWIMVAYLENTFKSWPRWKTQHSNYVETIQNLVDTLRNLVAGEDLTVYLNGHSGGGRFVFSFLDGVKEIPSWVKRISFLDSNYGYDSTYTSKIVTWLQNDRRNFLNVFAYNDSVALLEGKRIVSDTGGTWYRSHRMIDDLRKSFPIQQLRDDSVTVYSNVAGTIQFYLKQNPERKIFHTTQVELNGFIHSILIGTRRESRRYKYYGIRAYDAFVK